MYYKQTEFSSDVKTVRILLIYTSSFIQMCGAYK